MHASSSSSRAGSRPERPQLRDAVFLLAALVGSACDGNSASGLPDVDGDGYVAASAGGDDCDDRDASIHPGASAVPFNAVDESCVGSTFPNPRLVDGLLGASLAVGSTTATHLVGVGGAVHARSSRGDDRIYLGPLVYDVAVTDDGVLAAVALGAQGVALLAGQDGPLAVIARLTDHGQGVWLDSSRLFIARGNDGVAWYDVTDPTHPRIVTHRTDLGSVGDVAVAGSYVYAANQEQGLLVLGLGAGTLDGPYRLALDGLAQDVAVATADGRAYVAMSAAGVAVVDVATPTAPDPGSVTYLQPAAAALGVALGADRLFVAAGSAGVYEYALHALAAPAAHVPVTAVRVSTDGTTLAVAGQNDGGALVDVATAGTPGTPLRAFPGGAVGDVAVRDHWGFCTLGTAGLAVLDLSDRTAPRLVAQHALPALAHELAVIDDRVLVTYPDGLFVISLPDPLTLAADAIRTLPLGEAPVAVATAGPRALIVSASALFVVDLTSPTNPGTPHRVALPGTRTDVAALGTVAVMSGSGPALALYEVTDATAPTEVGAFNGTSRADAVAVEAPYLYVASATGVTILDASAPASPTSVATVALDTVSHSLAVGAGYLWIADAIGLQLVDVTVPATPTTPRRVASNGVSLGLALGAEVALVAGVQRGVEVVDLADSTRSFGAQP